MEEDIGCGAHCSLWMGKCECGGRYVLFENVLGVTVWDKVQVLVTQDEVVNCEKN